MAKDANDKQTEDLSAQKDKHAWLTPDGQQAVMRALNLRAAQLKRQINTEDNEAIKNILKQEYQHVLQLINIV